MKRKFKNKEVVRVKIKNTHGFNLKEKIQIIKLDPTAIITGTDINTPVYYAKSINNPKNKWWIAETEISKIRMPKITKQ